MLSEWPEMLLELGNVLRQLGRYEEARQAYDRALDIGRDRTDVLWALAHSAHGARESLVGIHADSRRAGQSGTQVGRGTIANILREHGIEPAPERDRHTRWSTFLKAHWECLTATDFLSVEVYTIKGLVTYYILFFIDIASRSVHTAGVTPYPDNRWMKQIALNVTEAEGGFLRGTRHLILARDTKYSDEFRNALGLLPQMRRPPYSLWGDRAGGHANHEKGFMAW